MVLDFIFEGGISLLEYGGMVQVGSGLFLVVDRYRGCVSGGEADLVDGEEDLVGFVAVCECAYEGVVV